MDYILILGWIASVITVIYTAIGLPTQIVKNFKIRSGEGLSLFLFIILLLTFISWVVYGLAIFNWFIIIPNGFGGICSMILTIQIIYYKTKNKRHHLYEIK